MISFRDHIAGNHIKTSHSINKNKNQEKPELHHSTNSTCHTMGWRPRTPSTITHHGGLVHIHEALTHKGKPFDIWYKGWPNLHGGGGSYISIHCFDQSLPSIERLHEKKYTWQKKLHPPRLETNSWMAHPALQTSNSLPLRTGAWFFKYKIWQKNRKYSEFLLESHTNAWDLRAVLEYSNYETSNNILFYC